MIKGMRSTRVFSDKGYLGRSSLAILITVISALVEVLSARLYLYRFHNTPSAILLTNNPEPTSSPTL
jgi:hypothetical protein